jgi:SnoaL-like protein
MLAPPVTLAILDMIEDGDRVAVRWKLSATYLGEPFHLAMMSIYRFEGGSHRRRLGHLYPGRMAGLVSGGDYVRSDTAFDSTSSKSMGQRISHVFRRLFEA